MIKPILEYVTIEQAKRVIINGKRHYKPPTDEEYIGITTLLSETAEKDFTGWKEYLGEEALSDKKFVKELSQLEINLDKNSLEENQKLQLLIGTIIANHIFRTSGPIGTEAHLLNEEYLKGNVIVCENLLSRAHHNNFMPYLKKITHVYGIECMLYSHILKVGGTCDLIARYDDKLSIIDYKTKRSYRKEEYMEDSFIQGTAYSIMWEEMTGQKIEQIVILVSSEDNTSQEFIKDPHYYLSDLKDRIGKYYQNEDNSQ